MKLVLAAAFACLALATVSGDALAQSTKKKEGAGMTCAQRCSQGCQGKHHNCFDRCTTIRCAGK